MPSSPRGTRRADGRSATSPRVRASRPAAVASATATRAAPASWAQSASRMASTGWACSTTPPMADTWSRAERVSRAEPPPRRTTWSTASLAKPELGVGDHVANVVGQLVGVEQVELEVLRAAPDRGEHLLRVGGAEDEDHVRRRFLERLEQRVARARAEHVDLVEDHDLAVARRAERDALDELADVRDAVVGRGVELEEPVDDAALVDGDAVRAGAVGFAVDGVLAVEHLGEDARRGRLAGAARAAEEVGVAHPALRPPRCAAPAPRGPARAARRSASTGSAGRAPGTRQPSPDPTSAPAGASRARDAAPLPDVTVRRSAAHRRFR